MNIRATANLPETIRSGHQERQRGIASPMNSGRFTVCILASRERFGGKIRCA
jgi:hypothetical protein